ncbi:FUSC family protein [Rhodanobacter sp. BL-MT-08]
MSATTNRVFQALREAIVTMLAALATMCCALAIDPEPGPAILSVVLCVSLSRSQLDRDRRGRLEAALTLPVVSLAALGVGMLLLRAPWLGAGFFVVAISMSIWLRRFGPLVRRAGSLVALPFVVILTTPYVPTTRVGPAMTLLLPIVVALLALFWVSVLHMAARRVRWLPAARAMKHVAASNTRPSSLRPAASSRMAIQMAVALAIAFVVGYIFFAERWAWIVLTAFIVGSGNQGRLDVAYKSLLRVVGAGVGTLLALAFANHTASDTATIGLILAAVFMGIWLRPLGYAWWAMFVTLALALLQGFEGPTVGHILSLRLEEIVIGAIIGIAAAWFVLPVRSTGVLRLRIAESLVALADALDPANTARSPDDFLMAMDRVSSVAPAFRVSRLLTRRLRIVQPADWVDALTECRRPAIGLIETGATPGAVRKAVGAARKAMREPEEILQALQNLRSEMI